MHQSVRYSTSLLRNLISCLKARSSLLFIMASTSWYSLVLMWSACTVVSRWCHDEDDVLDKLSVGLVDYHLS